MSLLSDLIKTKKTMFSAGDVTVYDHELKTVTSSGNELVTVLQDMGGYLPVASPKLVSCVWPDFSSETPSDQTYSLSSGGDGPIVGVILRLALGSTDTPRLLDFSISGTNNTRGTGYSVTMSHIKADMGPSFPMLGVLFCKLNGKNVNVYASCDTLSLVIHTTSGLKTGDLIKAELINVGHAYYEDYLNSMKWS